MPIGAAAVYSVARLAARARLGALTTWRCMCRCRLKRSRVGAREGVRSCVGAAAECKKCASVCLHPNGPTAGHDGMEVMPAANGASVRYLGTQISSARRAKHVWDEVIRSVQIRMLLGIAKTADEVQRPELAKAVIIPKLTYAVRHTPLDAQTVTRLQHCLHKFVWNGWFDTAKRRGGKLESDSTRAGYRGVKAEW
ncbi:hypothetical protein PybrP1_003746, partial [[Pythium] brassicae (nom. inval.)]